MLGRRCWLSSLPILTRTSNPKNGNSRNGGAHPKKVVVTALTYHHWRLRSVQRPQLRSTRWGIPGIWLSNPSRDWTCSHSPMPRLRYRKRPGGLSLRGGGLSVRPEGRGSPRCGPLHSGENQGANITTNRIVSVRPLELRTRCLSSYQRTSNFERRLFFTFHW